MLGSKLFKALTSTHTIHKETWYEQLCCKYGNVGIVKLNRKKKKLFIECSCLNMYYMPHTG